jgi:hypothetical protein
MLVDLILSFTTALSMGHPRLPKELISGMRLTTFQIRSCSWKCTAHFEKNLKMRSISAEFCLSTMQMSPLVVSIALGYRPALLFGHFMEASLSTVQIILSARFQPNGD